MQNLNITLFQSNLYWESIDSNLNDFENKIKNLKEETDLIVLPEMFSTGFTMNSKKLAEKMNGRTIEKMKNWAKEKNCVITGSIIIQDGPNYFNRLIWMKPDGTLESYDKRHLFRIMEEHKHYTAGTSKKTIEIKGWKICPLICYDLRFPVWTRNVDGYDCIILIANWPAARKNAWTDLLKARAHENQTYVIGVNRVGEDGNGIPFSGNSIAIDPTGNPLLELEPNKEIHKTVSLSYNKIAELREKFPAHLDMDKFTLHL